MSTPDFDSMSPEELMAWMESLARRQGADEGFTTDTVIDVPEVDPTTVEDTGPGYIPYGMDAEKWAQKQRQEEERKVARRAAAAASAASPIAVPQPVVQQSAPPPQPVPAAVSASATPDFDSMSPEELMAWMESLAKRQGVDAEQLTTNASVDIPEIDPATVADTGPGYIPYGMDADKWAEKQRQEEERKAARRAASAAPPVAPPIPQAPEPVFELPPLPNMVSDDTSQMNSVVDNPLAWLESLGGGASGGQNVDLPELDLSALGAPLDNASAQSSDDPMAWLESLSQGSANIPGLEQFALDLDPAPPTAPPTAPPAAPPPSRVPARNEPPAAPLQGENPLEWLESLARRQGVDAEELTTNASMEVPLPETVPISQGPGYTEYTFETPSTDDADTLKFLDVMEDDDFESEFDSEQLDSTSAWLEALASGQNFEEAAADRTPDTSEIMDQLAKNQVNPNDIENWMANLLEQGASRNDVADYVADEEEETIEQAQLPDWLIEQVGLPPAAAPSVPIPAPLVNQIVEPPAVEMPDWLTEDLDANAALDFESIFDDAAEEPVLNAMPRISTDEIEFDSSDPWVEAFEMERKQGLDNINQIPAWYSERLAQDEEDMAQAEFMSVPSPVMPDPVVDSLPPESELVPGELQALPVWLADMATSAPPAATSEPAPQTAAIAAADDMPDWLKAPAVVEAVSSGDLPDWLREAGLDAAEVPDWLKDTLSTEETAATEPAAEQPAAEQPAAVVQPSQIVPVVPAAPVSPAIVPVAAARIDVNSVLETARSEFHSGNVEAALHHYEAVVRANTSLDVVVGDLATVLGNETYKKNPAVYRVLGDGLMRQGKLQEALDMYRKALNLL